MNKLPTAPLVGELVQLGGLAGLAFGLVAARHDWRVLLPTLAGVVALSAGRRLRRL
jgi:hypothetical protein